MNACAFVIVSWFLLGLTLWFAWEHMFYWMIGALLVSVCLGIAGYAKPKEA